MGGSDPSIGPTAGPASAASGPSRLTVALVALATVTVFAPAAIAGSGSFSSAELETQAPARTMPGFAVDVADAEPRALIEHVPTDVFDQTTLVEDSSQPLMWPPTIEPTIRPGRQITMRFDDAAARCTMNFVYQVDDATGYTAGPDQPDLEAGDLLIGTAGHCVLPEDLENSTEDGYNQPEVRVCVFACAGSQASTRVAQFAKLDEVLYARQEHDGEVLGEDYAFVKVPEGIEYMIEPTTPVWGGPVGTVDEILGGEQVANYGQGVGYGDAELDARVGFGLPMIFQSSPGAFLAALPSAPGDSGGPILSHQDPFVPGPVEGKAVGDLTHLVAGATAGTLSDHAVDFTAEETGVQLALVAGNPDITAAATP